MSSEAACPGARAGTPADEELERSGAVGAGRVGGGGVANEGASTPNTTPCAPSNNTYTAPTHTAPTSPRRSGRTWPMNTISCRRSPTDPGGAVSSKSARILARASSSSGHRPWGRARGAPAGGVARQRVGRVRKGGGGGRQGAGRGWWGERQARASSSSATSGRGWAVVKREDRRAAGRVCALWRRRCFAAVQCRC
jgi:hypothetical protein